MKLAIQNSLVETKKITSLDSVPQMPVFRPSKAQFKNPIEYIHSLLNGKEQIAKYGCIKIVPPEGFNPPLAFDMHSGKKLPTRYQILQRLMMSKPFDQNENGHTFEDF